MMICDDNAGLGDDDGENRITVTRAPDKPCRARICDLQTIALCCTPAGPGRRVERDASIFSETVASINHKASKGSISRIREHNFGRGSSTGRNYTLLILLLAWVGYV